MSYEMFKKLCDRKGLTASDVSKATGVSGATLTSWKKGDYTPKLDKLQKIADYFQVSVDYLITGRDSKKESIEGTEYYFSDETAEMAQEIFDDAEKRILFDAARNSRPEDLQMAADLLRRLKETNPDG